MSRALAILKFFPAVLSGLLVVAWVVSLFAVCGVRFRSGKGSTDAEVVLGSIKLRNSPHISTNFQPTFARLRRELIKPGEYLGNCDYGSLDLRSVASSSAIVSYLSVPIPFLLTLLLPLAIAPFIRFRFPLWSWFAFTALVAVELAYYLR